MRMRVRLRVRSQLWTLLARLLCYNVICTRTRTNKSKANCYSNCYSSLDMVDIFYGVYIFKTFLGNLHYFMKISNLFLHFPRFEPYQFWLSTSHHLSTHFDRPNRPRILREVFHQNECWLHYVVCPHLDRTRCWN